MLCPGSDSPGNGVRVDATWFGHRQQEQIEFFGRFGQPWEETARFPTQCRSNASLAMHPLLIGFHQERPQTNIKFGQAEHGSGWRRASSRVPRLMAEEELVRGFEDALDSAASARFARDREDQSDVKFGRDLLQVV